MRSRLLALLLLASAVSHAPLLWGLGLGGISATSALNEPLAARIELLNVQGLAESDLLVAIGSEADYRIAGVEREYYHTGLNLTAHLANAPSGPHISLSSTEALREPYLNLVVQVRWPQGKLVREYTLLLDLPVFSGTTETRTPSAAQAGPQPTFRPPPPARTVSASTPSTTPIGLRAGEYRINVGETLWSLAGRLSAELGVSRHQAMLAIYQANPDAFARGDINEWRAGSLLRLPDRATATQLSDSAARAQFSRLQRGPGTSSIAATPLRSGDQATAPATRSGPALGGRLLLSAATDEDLAGGTAAAGQARLEQAQTTNQQLRQELDRSATENNRLREQISALEGQLEQATGLIKITNAELAQVRDAAAQAAQQAAVPVADSTAVANITAAPDTAAQAATPAAAEVQAAAPTPTETNTAAQPQAGTQTALATDAAVQTVAQADDTSVTTPPIIPALNEPPPPDLLATALEFAPYAGAALAVVLLVLLLLSRRNPTSDNELFAETPQAEPPPATADSLTAQTSADRPATTPDHSDATDESPTAGTGEPEKATAQADIGSMLADLNSLADPPDAQSEDPSAPPQNIDHTLDPAIDPVIDPALDPSRGLSDDPSPDSDAIAADLDPALDPVLNLAADPNPTQEPNAELTADSQTTQATAEPKTSTESTEPPTNADPNLEPALDPAADFTLDLAALNADPAVDAQSADNPIALDSLAEPPDSPATSLETNVADLDLPDLDPSPTESPQATPPNLGSDLPEFDLSDLDLPAGDLTLPDLDATDPDRSDLDRLAADLDAPDSTLPDLDEPQNPPTTPKTDRS